MIKIADKFIGTGYPVFIIAEAGVNHDGEMKKAIMLVDQAKKAGADAVKFQTYEPKRLLRRDAQKPEYQKKNVPYESQYEMLERLNFSINDLSKVIEYGKKKGIIVFSTPYDEKSADDLEKIGAPLFKLASIEVVNHPFLRHMAKKGKTVILSTGLSTEVEIDEAVDVFNKYGSLNNLILLHCHVNYPSKYEDLNLNCIKTFVKKYKIPVGFSDHTQDLIIPSIAVSLGAKVIEKHLTYDKRAKGPDHSSSVEPDEFKEMVKRIRLTEVSLGNGIRKPSEAEIKNLLMRKSLVAARDIKKGEKISKNDLTAKRPGSGLYPTFSNINKLVGKKAKKNIKIDDILKSGDVQ